jgi:glutathione reductase (NADPH)
MAGFDFDLFVIGGGSGGVRAGRLAASLGRKVGIAEEYRYGGTCVIRGCVPKKLLVYASQFAETFEDAAGFGWHIGDTTFDWSRLIANKDREIHRLEGLYRKGLESNGAQTFVSRAVLEGPHEIRLLSENRIVTAERILIAVGGSPNRLKSLEGHEHCITSDEVFHLHAQPESIIIKGGGYIAVEFACIFAALGTKTTLIYRGDHILRGFDHDISAALAEEMTRKGIRVILNANFAKVEQIAGIKRITLDDGTALDAQEVMLAVGRLANTDGLGLEKAGVKTDRLGNIPVDEYSRSDISYILAVGDVTNRVPLTPVAIHEAMCLIETEFQGTPTRPDHEMIATAVFSQPEIGAIGLSENLACQKFEALDVYLTSFRPMKHTLSGRDEKTVMKIIVDHATDRVVGVHILDPDAGEMVQMLAIAMKMGASKRDFDRTMAVHPTAGEEIVTLYAPSYRVINGKRREI